MVAINNLNRAESLNAHYRRSIQRSAASCVPKAIYGLHSVQSIFARNSARNLPNAVVCFFGDEICVMGRRRLSEKRRTSLSGRFSKVSRISGASFNRLSVWVTRALDRPRCLAMSAWVA